MTNKQPSQADQILAWLQQGRSINQEECTSEFSCHRLAARVHELRQRGYVIRKVDEATGFPIGRAARYYLASQNGAAPVPAKSDGTSWRRAGNAVGDQIRRIIDLLVSGRGITQRDANRVGDIRLAATIARLRAEGLPILTLWESSGRSRYACYCLDVAAWCGMEQVDA